jgi:hypothetical protein
MGEWGGGSTGIESEGGEGGVDGDGHGQSGSCWRAEGLSVPVCWSVPVARWVQIM